MAEMQKFELLSSASNAVVARHLERNFPGVLIQGDTLRIILDDIEELRHELTAADIDSAQEIADSLRDRFVDILSHYEQVLEEHGYELPYIKRVRP